MWYQDHENGLNKQRLNPGAQLSAMVDNDSDNANDGIEFS